MKPRLIQVIPAQPGFFTVLDFREDRLVEVYDQVIAWRIETHDTIQGDSVFSTCMPITVDGDMVSNCIGIQNPDMSVTVFEDSTYNSIAALQAFRYPAEGAKQL